METAINQPRKNSLSHCSSLAVFLFWAGLPHGGSDVLLTRITFYNSPAGCVTLKAENGKIQRQVITRKGESGRESEGCFKLEQLIQIASSRMHHLRCLFNSLIYIPYKMVQFFIIIVIPNKPKTSNYYSTNLSESEHILLSKLKLGTSVWYLLLMYYLCCMIIN